LKHRGTEEAEEWVIAKIAGILPQQAKTGLAGDPGIAKKSKLQAR
jgi:hypothetical protein